MNQQDSNYRRAKFSEFSDVHSVLYGLRPAAGFWVRGGTLFACLAYHLFRILGFLVVGYVLFKFAVHNWTHRSSLLHATLQFRTVLWICAAPGRCDTGGWQRSPDENSLCQFCFQNWAVLKCNSIGQDPGDSKARAFRVSPVCHYDMVACFGDTVWLKRILFEFSNKAKLGKRWEKVVLTNQTSVVASGVLEYHQGATSHGALRGPWADDL